MKFFIPVKKYRVVSITGNWCALNCSHCNRRYLEGMTHVKPGTLLETLASMHRNGVRGVLISGGFSKDSTLPIEPYLGELLLAKKQTGIWFSAHLGLITNINLLTQLRHTIDLVDYEFTQSTFIVNHIRRLPNEYVRTYKDALNAMVKVGLKVVPHVYAWYPSISRESLISELEYIESIGMRQATLLIYIPPSRNYPVPITEMIDMIRYARRRFGGELYLGCMRPPWVKSAIDKIVVEEELVDRVANPYHKLLKDLGNKYELFDACCSVPDEVMDLFKWDN